MTSSMQAKPTYDRGGKERNHEITRLQNNLSNFDSKWVSPIQVLPKKTSITMIENYDDDMVLTQVQNECFPRKQEFECFDKNRTFSSFFY